MSLMLKLLATTLLLSSFLYAQNNSDAVEEFLENQFSDNSRVDDVSVNVENVVPLKDLKGWDAYIVNVSATLKRNPKDKIRQKMIWFSNGTMIARDIINLKSGKNLQEVVKPKFKDSYYKDSNLIYGNKNAKHKIAIFSDPLCPFCKGFVPYALEDLKDKPNEFAVYYYHFPLVRLHPASVTLVKAAVAAELKGAKDVVLKLYNVDVEPRETNVAKILNEFNKVEGTNLVLSDLESNAVKKQLKEDVGIAQDLMVGGTPTVFLDGKIDNTKKKYLKVK